MAGFRAAPALAVLYVFLFGFASQQAQAQNFAFYYYVIQWPAAFCQLNSCNSNFNSASTAWTIHGLWPNNDACGSYPQNCGGTYSSSQIDGTTYSSMHMDWPSYKGTSDSFWGHEWTKHGTCSGNTEDAYFSNGISLYSTYGSMYDTLANLGYTPGNSYDASALAADVSGALGSQVEVHCSSGYLTEIWICIGSDGQTPQDCGCSPSCGTVYYY